MTDRISATGIAAVAVLLGAMGAARAQVPCSPNQAERDKGVTLALPQSVLPDTPFDVRIEGAAGAPQSGACDNTQWVRVPVTVARIQITGQTPTFVNFNRLDARRRINNGEGAPLDSILYVDVARQSKFIAETFRLITRPLALPKGPRSLDDLRFDVAGDTLGQRDTFAALATASGRHRLVLIVCAQICTRGMVDDVLRREQLELATEAGAPAQPGPIGGQVQPPGSGPDPKIAELAKKQEAERKAAADAKRRADEARRIAEIESQHNEPTGSFKLVGYDSKTSEMLRLSSQIGRAVWGSCSKRDDFGFSKQIEESGLILVYGQQQGNRTLCIALQNAANAVRSESCYAVPAALVQPMIKDRSIGFPLDLRDGQLQRCEQSVDPWRVQLMQSDGTAFDPALVALLANATEPWQIADLPLSQPKADGTFDVSLRREHIDALSKGDAPALDPIGLPPRDFKRLSVVVDRPNRLVRVVVEPRVVDLANITFEFRKGDAENGAPETGCDFRLEVPASAQRGRGWAKAVREPLKLSHQGKEKYDLRLGNSKDQQLLRGLLVTLESGGGGAKEREEIKLVHGTPDNGRTCYLASLSLKENELTSKDGDRRVIKRAVGQPNAGLIVFLTTDRANADLTGMEEKHYRLALTSVVEALTPLPNYRLVALGAPFDFAQVQVSNDIADVETIGGSGTQNPLDASTLSKRKSAIEVGLRDRTTALAIEMLRTRVASIFKARGHDGTNNPPAAIVHIGSVLKPTVGANFCTSSLTEQVRRMDWLPPERQLLKISFATRATIDGLAKAETLRQAKGAEFRVIYECVHNAAGHFEEYVIAVPAGQDDGDNNREVSETLQKRAQELFRVKRVD